MYKEKNNNTKSISLPWNASPGMVSFTFLEEMYSWNLLSSIWSRLSSVPFSLNDLSIFLAAAEGSLPIDTYSFNTYTVSSLIAESRISNALLFKQSNAFLSAAHLSNNLAYSFLLCAWSSRQVASRQTANANSRQIRNLIIAPSRRRRRFSRDDDIEDMLEYLERRVVRGLEKYRGLIEIVPIAALL